jgi:hypothetical protein
MFVEFGIDNIARGRRFSEYVLTPKRNCRGAMNVRCPEI